MQLQNSSQYDYLLQDSFFQVNQSRRPTKCSKKVENMCYQRSQLYFNFKCCQGNFQGDQINNQNQMGKKSNSGTNTIKFLRGGGCGSLFQIQDQTLLPIQQVYNKNVFDFFKKFIYYVQIIESKASLAANTQESQEIMKAIQWFILWEENIYHLNKNFESVKKLYDLILNGIQKLTKSCLIYIRTDQFKCLYILQIATSLSKVIFTFHLTNNQRFMKEQDQKSIIEICKELRQQIEIEKNDLIQNQIELYLFLVQTSFEIAPTDGSEKEEIFNGCLKSILTSILQMSPDIDLLEFLYKGACLLYKTYDVSAKRKQYEVYFQIDMLQWEVLTYFKSDSGRSLEEIILRIQSIYEAIVKNSKNWNHHYLWIQMIGRILNYNPPITKNILGKLNNSINYQLLSQIWKEYKNNGLLIYTNYDNNEAVIVLNQLQNTKTLKFERLILQNCFKGWENLLMLKEFLMNEQQEKIPYSFGFYLKVQLNFQNKEIDSNILILNKIKTILSFVIPNNQINLLQQTYDKLIEVEKIWRNFRVEKQVNLKQKQVNLDEKQVNLKIFHRTYQQQIRKITTNLEEYFQNSLQIKKNFTLNLNQNPSETDQIQKNEFILIQELKFQLSVFQQMLQQSAQEIKDFQENGENFESKLIQQQEKLRLIVNRLSEKESKISFDKDFLQILNPLFEPQGKNLAQKAQRMIKLIENSQKQIAKQETQSLRNQSFTCFQEEVNKLCLYYKTQIQKINNDFSKAFKIHHEIFTFKNEIDNIPETETGENMKMIQTQFQTIKLTELVQNLRFNLLKQKLTLVSFKQSFYILLKSAKQQDLQQLRELLNCDNFLVDAIESYPQQIMSSSIYDEQLILDEKSMCVNEYDIFSKLSRQKGNIEFLLFKLNLDILVIDSKRQDLELIEKEFGELFAEKSSSSQLKLRINQIFDKVVIDKSVEFANDKLNELQLKKEQEKYKNFSIELTKISDFQEIKQINELINQSKTIETLFEQIQTSVNKNTYQILLKEELNGLKNKIEQFKIYCQKCEDQNRQSLGQQEKDVDDKNLKHLKFSQDEKYKTILNLLTKILKLQNSRIFKQKQILEKLLEEVKLFSDSTQLIQNKEESTKQEIMNNFNQYIKKICSNYQQLQQINFDTKSKENENIITYFDRISEGINNMLRNENKQNLNPEQKDQDNKNIYLFLNELKVDLLKIIKVKYSIDKTQIDQTMLCKQLQKIYFTENEQELIDVDSNYELELFDNDIQKQNNFNDNEEWKIKQGIIFSIIQISSNDLTNTTLQFCQKVLIQLWGQEKDQRVRNLLKNSGLINMQMQILQKGWKTQHSRVEREMQQMLKKIDDLQEQISHEVNLNKRTQQLDELDEANEQLEEYMQNISEMGQQLNLITDFVNHLRKNLARVEGKINQMKQQLKSMNNDIKFLRGKSVEQLLEIRKWKVLQDAAQKNMKSIYVPLKTQEKDQKISSTLMNLDQFNDKKGEVNEFLIENKETVLLIHGIAGSGKSTTAKKIEEFIWKLEDKKEINQALVPIYISLPSLKNPISQAVEEALRQDEYGFDELQLKECKEILRKKQFRFLLIMDSYDEMKLDNLQKNLYITNKINENWSNPLVIFTTRSEIFTSRNYAEWFTPQVKTEFKEVQLLKFDKDQQDQYLQKFAILSIKVLIFETYEWLKQIQNKGAADINKFEITWGKLEVQLEKQNLLEVQTECLLNLQQIDNILQLLENDEYIALRSKEARRSLQINLQKLWSVEKYNNMIKMINLDKLIETPYMMEIIVQVLPLMLEKATDIASLKQNFIKNFSNKFKKLLKQEYLIEKFKLQKNKLKKQQHNQQKVQIDIQKIEKIDYVQAAHRVWNEMELNQISNKFQFHQDFSEINKSLIDLSNQVNLSNLILQEFVSDMVEINKDEIIQLMCDALKEQNLTSFDFYDEFIRQHFLKQIEKLRNLGKSINVDRFFHDLKQYSTKLAKLMSAKQLTQVQYKQQGFLYKDQIIEDQWLIEFFNDDGQEGQYKKDIRSCTLVKQKGSSFQFVHKSIQEFLVASDLYEVLVLSKQFDAKIFGQAIQMIENTKEKTYDCIEFFSSNAASTAYNNHIQNENLQMFDKQPKLNSFQNDWNDMINFVKVLKGHDFNQLNYSTQVYSETRKYFIKKVQNEIQIIECLKFLVHLTAFDEKFIQSGSNALNLLVEMKINLSNKSFQGIKIKNTTLAGANFINCNLSGSDFENVNINGINLNGAFLFNCKWKNLRINELHQFNGHKLAVNQICISVDGTLLASGSKDSRIFLWDVESGDLKRQLDEYNGCVYSVCFSPDSTKLASGIDNMILVWNVITGEPKNKLNRNDKNVYSVFFTPDGNQLISGSEDKFVCIWDVQTGELISKIQEHQSTIWSVCCSPSGDILASGGEDKEILLWEIKSESFRPKLSGHTGSVLSVSFSPNGDFLASGSKDNSICLWDVKTSQLRQQLNNHSGWVFSVQFSPDGTKLASGSKDKSIRLWDVKSGEQKSKLIGHRGWVKSIFFSPNGNTLMSGSEDTVIRLWDINTVEQKQQFDGHNDSVLSVNFSPDGTLVESGSGNFIGSWDINTGQSEKRQNKKALWEAKSGSQKSRLDGHLSSVQSVSFLTQAILASGSGDKTIRLWDLESGEEKRRLDGHLGAILSVCLSPDGQTLASSSRDKSICLWNVGSGQQILQLEGHNGYVNDVCFSPDGKILASASEDKSIRVWDVETGEQKWQLEGHIDAVLSISFSPNGEKLASGSEDQTIKFWDIKTGCLTMQFEGHTEMVFSISYSPDGQLLASGSTDRTIRLWNAKTGEQKMVLDGQEAVLSVCFSPDNTTLASGGVDKSIRLWNLQTGAQTQQLNGHTDWVLSTKFSPDGSILASGSRDNSIRLWSLQIVQPKQQQYGHSDIVMSVCFSPDGLNFATGSRDQSIIIWNLKNGEKKHQLNGHSGSVMSLCFSFDGALLASGSADCTACVWDVKEGKQQCPEFNHEKHISALCFSPDGKTLATGSQDDISLWDVKMILLEQMWNQPNHAIWSVSYSPDGLTLASGGEDKQIILWDITSGIINTLIRGHCETIISLCFSPDGITLASGSKDKLIYLWDLATGTPKEKLQGHEDQINSVCFSPDGSSLASASADESIRLWDLNFGNQRETNYLQTLQGQKDQSLKKFLGTNNINIETRFLISPYVQFQAFGATIDKGEFYNHLGMNLKLLFKQKGGVIE